MMRLVCVDAEADEDDGDAAKAGSYILAQSSTSIA